VDHGGRISGTGKQGVRRRADHGFRRLLGVVGGAGSKLGKCCGCEEGIDRCYNLLLTFSHERMDQVWVGSSGPRVRSEAVAMTRLKNEGMTEREEVDFRVLRALSADPESSQRQLARTAGVSLGAVNYCLRALVEKGLVKVQNFRASDNKLRYAYVLTPTGVGEKFRLTKGFIDRKIIEYERLSKEIADVMKDLDVE
jgi:EPS-associated MarR family transcriptional regulator